MRATRSNGRPGTAVLPDGWGLSHATAIARTRTATITLTAADALPTPGGWDPETETYGEATAPTPYASSVRASIVDRQTTGDPRVETAGETVLVFDYVIGVDHGQDADEGDIVTVTAAPGDTALVGRRLLIERTALGSERFERVLYCTLQGDQDEEATP